MESLLSQQNLKKSAAHENDLTDLMGIHSSLEELYCRSNMVILSITLNTRNVKMIMNTVKILANFNNIIADVIELACKFWELDISSFILIDTEHSITVPISMSVLSIYKLKGGKNLIDFKLVNKYNNIFDILTSHQRSIRLDRNERALKSNS